MAAKKKPVFKRKKEAVAPVVVKKPKLNVEAEAARLIALGVVEVTLPDGRCALQGPSAMLETGRVVKTSRNADGSAGKVHTVGEVIRSQLGVTLAEIRS